MRLCTQGCLFSIGGPKPIRQFVFDTGCPRLTHNSCETFPGRTGRRPSFWRGLRAPCVSFDELNTLGHVLAGQAHEPHSVEKTSGAASGGRQRVARQAREAQQGHEVLGVGRALATCRSRSQAPQANPKRCHVKCMYVIMFCGALSAGMRRQKTRKPVSREFRGRITMVVALTET